QEDCNLADAPNTKLPTFQQYCWTMAIHMLFTAVLVTLIILSLIGTLDLLGSSSDPAPGEGWGGLLKGFNLSLLVGVLVGCGLLYAGWRLRDVVGKGLEQLGGGLWWAGSQGWNALNYFGIALQPGPNGIRGLMVVVWVVAVFLAAWFNPGWHFT